MHRSAVKATSGRIIFFFNDTATTEIYTLSLHDALPIFRAIAREVAPKRINIVSPGTIDTPMVATQGEERATFYAKATEIGRAHV